jgi:hypothetical protein
MTTPAASSDVLRTWLAIPADIEEAIEGLSEDELDQTGGPDRWSIRETVHHLVEANLVASNILLSALARSGAVFDWSWVMPNAAWMQNMRYATAPVGPAIKALRALQEHLAAVIENIPDALGREVKLLDAPSAAPHTETVAGILRQEIEHALQHLRAAKEISAPKPD